MKKVFLLTALALCSVMGFSQSCLLENLTIDVSPCDDTDSVDIVIDFDYMDVSDSFRLMGYNNNFGKFAYTDLPLNLGRFAPDCMTEAQFFVQDKDDPDCTIEASEGILCCTCSIENLSIVPTDCMGDSCMTVIVDFNPINPGSGGFDVFRDGNQLIGTYQYNQLPLTIDCWPVTGQSVEVYTVCDALDSDCCEKGQFATLGCDSCIISNVRALPSCDSNQMFNVLVNFNFDMPGDSGYIVNINDSLFGPYSYDTTMRTFGPFQGGCDSVYTIAVFDKEFPYCGDTISLEKPCCDPCVLGGIMAEALECNGDSCMRVRIDFDHVGTGISRFDVFSNNGLVGTYSYSQLPLIIDCFPITDPDVEYIRVCDVDSVGCCAESQFPSLDCGPDCEITDLTVTETDCDFNGDFLVTIDFNHANSSDSFYVFGHGRALGPFPYSALPIQIGPFAGDCVTNYEFIVTDAEDILCRAEAILGRICCTPCEITNLDIEAVGCNGDSCLIVEIDFDHSGTGNEFDIFTVNGYFGTYNYAQLPLTINCYPISGLATEYIKICDLDLIACCAVDNFPTLDCGPDTCKINNLMVEAIDCNGQDSFMAVVNFTYEDTCDNHFILQTPNGAEIHLYTDLPIVTGPFAGGCDVDLNFSVTDSACGTCTANFLLEDPCCGGDCELFDLSLNLSPCDTNNQFFIDIDFEQDNASDSFYIFGNGRNIGPLAYSDLPYTLGPLNGDCTTDYEVILVDSDSDSCRLSSNIGTVCCGDTCEVSNLMVDVIRCIGDTCLVLELDFNHQGTMSDSFDVFDINGYFDTYAYGDLPVIIECFPISGDTFEFIKVCNLDDPDCCTALEFDAVDCDQLCAIYDVVLQRSDCDSNNQFTVTLDFETDNAADSFYVAGNGRSEGPFAYDALPINLGPYDGDCAADYEFIIVDGLDPTCTSDIGLGVVCCGDTCRIYDLIVTESMCDTNNQFTVSIDLLHENTSDSFYVSGNGRNDGPFAFDDLPINLGPFDGDCTTSYEFILSDANDPSCSDAVILGTICCVDTCRIYDLTVTESMCDSNDMFTISLDFQHEHNSDSFYVSGNGRNEGPFAYDDLPLALGPYDGDCTTEYEFIVTDANEAACNDSYDLGIICCMDTCRVFDLVVTESMCDSNGMFTASLNFQYENNADSFYVTGNGRNEGPFAYTDLPVVLGPFDGDCSTEYEFIVTDSEDPACSTSFDLGVICCADTCVIYDLVVSENPCDMNDMFTVNLDFQHVNTSDSFYVQGNGRNIGPLAYSSLPVVLGPFDGDCATVYEFIVVDASDPTCSESSILGVICCDQPCMLDSLVVETTDCDSNDQFFVDIEFVYSNAADSFYVQGNGRNEGPFAYEDLPIRLGPYDGDCTTEYEFVIVDAEDPNCTISENIGVICCPPMGCAITTLIVDPSDCDSLDNFFTYINFDHQNTSDSFYVSADGRVFGPYAYEGIPLIVGPFEGDCITNYIFTVSDANDPNCRATVNLGTVCCKDTCDISGLSARAIRCNGDSCIEVTLDFDFMNTGSTFDVYDRNGLVGTYDYTMLPFLTIDCFPISGEDMEYLQVCDTDAPDCCADVEFDALDCTTGNVDLTSAGWEIYYNHHTQKLVINRLTGQSAPGALEISDMHGHIVETEKIKDNIELDMKELQNGVYITRFVTGGQQYFIKFIKL